VCGEKIGHFNQAENAMNAHYICKKKHGKSTDFTCDGCGKKIAKKVTKKALREGVIETVCPGCEVSVEIVISSVSVEG
jgi:transcription elongation factor Elf1